MQERRFFTVQHPLSEIKGIGTVRLKLFEKKGIFTAEDLIGYYPRDYEDRSKTVLIADVLPGSDVLVRGHVLTSVSEKRIHKGMTIYSMTVGDESGIMSVTWYNNKFVKHIFKKGDDYVFFGKINPKTSKKEMINPIYERPGAQKYTGKIIPIYPLWDKMTQKILQSAMSEAIKTAGTQAEYLPAEIPEKHKLCGIDYALHNIHFPQSFEAFNAARNRLVFEEFLILQLALMYSRGKKEAMYRKPYDNLSCAAEFISSLPYEMTGAQKRVIREMLMDLIKSVPMNRLIQGDVGSGKTVVAAAVMYTAHCNGYQSAIMAPTEILASQHYESFSEFFRNTDIKICLLTSATKKKKELYEKIKDGEFDIIIGTNAVIQASVEYKNLGLVISDEQHRFGVAQRAALTAKGEAVNTIVMTATPIPRTLSFILYGDLDISVIDELPPGRKPVETFAVGENMRERIYAFLEKQLKAGFQCYVVCPLIEETQNADLKNACDLQVKMQEQFPQYNVGLIHGKMKPQMKEEIMTDFNSGKINILVSTTVIEVGVNVPNANVMIIENAERFGLSQLHQLRGRVGRGGDKAYCVLFAHGSGKVTKKRMEIMCKSNDGFFISEEDLKLRGPGDFFGTRQHGLPEMKIANMFTDRLLLSEAQSTAKQIIFSDPFLKNPENNGLKEKVKEMFKDNIILN